MRVLSFICSFVTALFLSLGADASAEDRSDLFHSRLEFQFMYDPRPQEGSAFQPEAGKVQVSDVLLPHLGLGLFAYGQGGKVANAVYGGLHVEPLRWFADLPLSALHLSVDVGGGIGVGGFPVLGGEIEIVEDRGLILRLTGQYHPLFGLSEEGLFRFRPFDTGAFLEPWIGIFERMSGSGESFLSKDTLEGGATVGIAMRVPRMVMAWVSIPFGVREVRITPRFLFGLEFEL